MSRAVRVLSVAAALPLFSGSLAAQDARLCVNGHPAKRAPDCTAAQVPGCISYGGLAPRRGFQRDHGPYPLCLGQQDAAAHVHYQPIAQARAKYRLEAYACDSYCAGRLDLSQALQLFDDWRASYRQIFGESPK